MTQIVLGLEFILFQMGCFALKSPMGTDLFSFVSMCKSAEIRYVCVLLYRPKNCKSPFWLLTAS